MYALRIAHVVAAALVAPLWAAGSAARADAPGAQWGAGYLPNVPVVSQDGRKLRFYDDVLKGRAVAVHAIYTRCTDECPLEMARLVEMQRLLGERAGRDLTIVSVTLDPAHDSAARLKAYAERFSVGPGWLLLTGRRDDLAQIHRKLGLSRNSAVTNPRDGHAATLLVGNVASGQWMRHSAVDDPKYLAATIGNFLGWRDAPAGPSYADATRLPNDPGRHLFASRCAACHTIGGGDRIGPDLAGVAQRRDPAWIARYISAPEQVRGTGDAAATDLMRRFPQTRMPNLSLRQEDVGALVGYLQRGGRPSS